MRRVICTFLFSIMTLSFVCAQDVIYPEEYKSAFEKADATVGPSQDMIPVIGVMRDSDASLVLAAGGAPLVLNSAGAEFPALQSIAAALDGFILTGEPDLLLLKAIVDRNVPILGTCPSLEKIRKGQMALDDHIESVVALVHKASTYRHAKRLMERIISIDSHTDLPWRMKRGYTLGRRSVAQVSLPKMNESGLTCEALVAFTVQRGLDPESLVAAEKENFGLLDNIFTDVGRYGEYCGLARTSKDVRDLFYNGKKAFFAVVENAYGLGGKIENVKKLADMGVVYMTLCHSSDNDVCNSSSKTADPNKGLTEFGRKVVEEMNRYGIIVDLSHTSPGTFWDVYKYSKAPFICSHSGAKAVWDHNRNITDDQLRALAEKNGVIQVYIVPDFMDVKSKWGEVSIDHFMDHLLHCIEVAGIDHVGIGSDFDGGGGGWGMNGDNDVINITMRLIEHGFSDSDIRKIWGENFLRVLDEVQAAAEF